MKIAPRKPRPPKLPGGRSPNWDIWQEIAELGAESRIEAQGLTGQEAEAERQTAQTTARKMIAAERRDETKERQRLNNPKPAAALAKSAWTTYRQADREGDKAKAGHWKAYAIRNALIAIHQGETEGLPKKLIEAANRKKATPEREKVIYRLYVYRRGNIDGFVDKRTKRSAENAKAYREKSKGITCAVHRLPRENETLAALEEAAIEQTMIYAAYRKGGREYQTRPAKAQTLRLWQAYRAAGGKHPAPDGISE